MIENGGGGHALFATTLTNEISNYEPPPSHPSRKNKGVRVAYGVFTGELDPTPIKRNPIAGVGKSEDVVMPNVWDLMMNKKPTRKGGRQGREGKSGDSDNPFGL